MRRDLWLIAVIALLSGTIGIYFGAKRLQPEPAQALAVNQLFAQSMLDASGRPQALSQLKGKILLVNFWATWCTPCVEEMPELSALQTEVMSKNIQIIGIGIDSQANIAEFAAKYQINYPLYVATKNGITLSRQFGNQVGGLPYTVLIDGNGQVKKTYLGRLKLDMLRKDLASF